LPTPDPTEDSEQDHGAQGRNGDRGEIEAPIVSQPEQRSDDKATDKRADNSDNEVHYQTMAPPHQAFGEPAGNDTNHYTGNDVHAELLQSRNDETTLYAKPRFPVTAGRVLVALAALGVLPPLAAAALMPTTFGVGASGLERPTIPATLPPATAKPAPPT